MMEIKEYTYDEHWVMYRIVESLYCTPETNITLDINYISIFFKKNKINKIPVKKTKKNKII